MTVIPFRGRNLLRRSGRPVEPPHALGSAPTSSKTRQQTDDLDFYRLRARQNWAVLALVIGLVVGGAWLIERLKAYSRAMACYEAGHRNCIPLEIAPPPR